MKPKTKRSRRITLTILLAGGIAVILLVNIGLIILAYRTILQKRYLRVVKTQLTDACEEMTDAGFDYAVLDAIEDDGILILVYDTDSGSVLFDSREHSIDGAHGDFAENAPHNNRHKKNVDHVLSMIGENLPAGNGTFFNDSQFPPGPEEDTSREITLYGRQGNICFSLSCIVAPLSTALTLAIKLASLISLVVWLVSFVLIIFITSSFPLQAKPPWRSALTTSVSVRC